MYYKKFFAFAAGLISVAIVVSAFFSTEKLAIQIPFISHPQVHSLTGLPGSDAPVVVVKIDDTLNSHPQVGLSSADIVYIEQVEGGLTRLAAVYSSTIPQLVGPVRSARISDIDLLAQFGKVGFAYSGAQRKFLPVLAAAPIDDLGATHFGPRFYDNDVNRVVPYAMMLKLPEIIAEAQSKGATLEQSHSIGFTFGDTPDAGETFAHVRMAWPAGVYEAEWSESQKKFLFSFDGSEDVDSDGVRLGAENILIQRVLITDSEYKDKVGGVTPLIHTVGSGSCYLLRDGQQFPCLWSRSTSLDGTHITDLAGNELPFSPGRTWVALMGREPIFTY
jgi:hypothetical protein